ncbi:hypothetical protein [Nitratireductor aquibiodomus]|uniref:hypothetical protein n=1 Tax=Nitratireductor aquibiodomus TaxID=204799 RepID=UPI00046AA24A|nr:hypothetical protein [Nitratireductor aquibiodomus]
MLRDASQDMAIHLKDRLRDIRDLLRSHRHERQATAAAGRHFSDMEKLLARAASMVDDTLTLAETASRTVLPVRSSTNWSYGRSAIISLIPDRVNVLSGVICIAQRKPWRPH